MELRQLRYFVVLAEELHFARAAARLNIVQPALSMQIKRLENKLSTELFVRDRRTVALTPVGQLLFVEARQILEQVKRSYDIVKLATNGVVGRVRIGYSPDAICTGILSSTVKLFRCEAHNAELVLQDIHPYSQYKALITRQLDVVLGPSLSQLANNEIEETMLASFPPLIALPKNHRLSEYDSIDIGLLHKEVFIGYAGPGDPKGKFLTENIIGLELNFSYQASNPFMMLGLVDAGLGVAVVSSAVKHFFPFNLCWRPLLGAKTGIDVTMMSRKGETDPVILGFINTVRSSWS